MTSVTKTKLKLARDALASKDYSKARDAANQVIDFEPDNYNAHVFLGLALLELGEADLSEQAYRKATQLQPEQILAWQGICKLYERVQRWSEYVNTLHRLIDLFSRSNDTVKCAESIMKLINDRRQHGSRTEVVEVMCLLLPDSPYYSVLSTISAPDPTNPTPSDISVIQAAMHNSLPVIEEIVELTEREEGEAVKKGVDKRRMRLGASTPEQLRKEVGVEIWGFSKLPHLYNEILNHPNTPDDLRRATESKFLRQRERYLHALPGTGKSAPIKEHVANEVRDLVDGMVLLAIPDELAWMIFIESKDCDVIDGYDFSTLLRYMKLFPQSSFCALLTGYFSYIGFPLSSSEGEEVPDPRIVESDDPVDLMLDAFNSLPNSLLAHRIIAEVHLSEEDYSNAIKVAERGLALTKKALSDTGQNLLQVQKAFKTALATSFVYLFPPKHHPRALDVINDVLEQDPDNVVCLMNRGVVLEHSARWDDAGKLFTRVEALVSEISEMGLRAKEEHAWCLVKMQVHDAGLKGLEDTLLRLDALENKEKDKARCTWRIGMTLWEAGSKREEAFSRFITSLKYDATYAPAFTSLGIHYLEHANPPDTTRASKCFQKAFELDAREAEAARRLAEGFAEEREWDLVEVVARRTIEGEGGLDAGIQGTAGPTTGRFLPTNAWAWKALGIVELTRKNYPLAIQAFQIALRADTNDQPTWLRLGEAYSQAGRHAAAVKALARAQELNPDDWVCSFLMGEVQRQLGHHEEAIQLFQSVLTQRVGEIGILMSLAQTHLDLGRAELLGGYINRAEESFLASIRVALEIIDGGPGFRALAWKIAADSIFSLSKLSSFVDSEGTRLYLLKVTSILGGSDPSARLRSISSVLPDLTSLDSRAILEISIAAYDCRISLSISDGTPSGSAWFDLAIALHTWTQHSHNSDQELSAETLVISCLKEAIREDPGNYSSWNAFGHVNFKKNPKIAQHAYIRALEIDSKNVIAWASIGLLYLYHEDLSLANEAFRKAQTLDPDYPVSWVGQSLVALMEGHNNGAKGLLEHAVGLTANVPEIDLEFASRAFASNSSLDDLYPMFFVLDGYCKKRPQDATALHLFGLVCERIGQRELAADLISKSIAVLEALYEDTEDAEVEKKFAIATCNLARVQLSLSDYELASEGFDSALGLLPESKDATTLKLQAHAQFGLGLTKYKLGQLEAAISMFEEAMETAASDPLVRGQITVLLAQSLWALGTEELRETAKAQLLECISDDPENLPAINALAAMGILSQDNNLIDAALSEILSLPWDKRHKLDPNHEVEYLLVQHHLGEGDVKKAIATAQRATFAEPSRMETRNELTSLLLKRGDPQYASAVLAGVSSTSATRGLNKEIPHTLGLGAVVDVLLGGSSSALTLAQRAVMLSPYNVRNWQILSYIRSKVAST